ncbi:hypothetical protein PF010_g27933, partial [Phytophthora fragariae]
MNWLLGGNQRPKNDRFLTPKKTPFELAQHYVPILKWLPSYQVGQDLKFDLVAGITVAMMLIPQEVSLSTIMHVPARLRALRLQHRALRRQRLRGRAAHRIHPRAHRG